MSPAFAKLVMPVFRQMFALMQKLNQGDPASLDSVRSQVSQWVQEADRRAGTSPETRAEFDGAKYALVGWIDEVLTDSTWGHGVGWGTGPHLLEWDLYGSRARSAQFYATAANAARSSGIDALELHLLCVTVGFRGDFRHDSDGFNDWVAETYERIAQKLDLADRPFPESTGTTRPEIVPRGGASRLLTASLVASVAALATLAAYILSVHESLI